MVKTMILAMILEQTVEVVPEHVLQIVEIHVK